jgi:hypothetical protein
MKNAPKRAKKCTKCAALARVAKLAKVAPQALVVQKVAAVNSRRTRPRCSRNSTKTTTANSAKTNSWRWRKPSVNTCGGPAGREVRKVRDPKVAGQVALKDMHDLRGADRQVHQWAHGSKAAVVRIAVLLVVQKVVAPSAAVSMAHLHVVVSIANASQVRLKAVGLNANALNVVPKAADLSASDSLVRATVNSNANDLQVRHADVVSTASDSLARPIVHVLNVTVMRGAQNDSATNATDLPVPRAAAGWIASASPVHSKVVALRAPVRRVLHSICG